MKNRMNSIMDEFKKKKILVIGDIMLDKYIWGEVSRISPEAPVQVVNAVRESYAPGGASNVANNVAALGAGVFMVGVAGEDLSKDTLVKEMKSRGINTEGILIHKNSPTIQKIRILAKSQQLLRVDYESKDGYPEHLQKEIAEFINSKIEEIDGVIISDYAKGVITKSVAEHIIKKCSEKEKIVVVDPKPKNTLLYKNVDMITPNHFEASEMSGLKDIDDNLIDSVGFKITTLLNTNVLITRGEKGMSLFQKDGGIFHIPTKGKEVYNIIGAGDTVVAVATLALVSGASLKEAAMISNIAAGIKVSKIEYPTVSIDEIKKYIEYYENE